MTVAKSSYFDQAATTWDDKPFRIGLMKALGEAILHAVQPTPVMDVLDYGCGTGLVGLYLLPHVRSVTGADNSSGMLDVLRKKIADGGLAGMDAVQFDLERDPLPAERYDMVVTSMTLHHVRETAKVLRAFHKLLRPGGVICLADLDTEPGSFHAPEAASSVHHHGFDREDLKALLVEAGFVNVNDVTAHVLRKPVEDGTERDFPVFLITANLTLHGLPLQNLSAL